MFCITLIVANPDPGSALEKKDSDSNPDPDPGYFLILRVQLFLQFLADAFRLGSGSVDSHTFVDPDPNSGSQNFADSTDPDPKHWYIVLYNFKTECILCCTTLKLNVYCVVQHKN